MAATGPAEYFVPITIPGGKPVIAVPGLTPRFPTIKVAPVLVNVEEPKTAKLLAVPMFGLVVAAKALLCTMLKAEIISIDITK